MISGRDEQWKTVETWNHPPKAGCEMLHESLRVTGPACYQKRAWESAAWNFAAPLLAQKVMPIMNQIPCSLKNAWDMPALRLLDIVQHWSGFSVLIHDGSVPSRNVI